MRQLVGHLLQPAGSAVLVSSCRVGRRSARALVETMLRLRASSLRSDAGEPMHDDVERGAAVAQRLEHLVVVPVAQLRAFGGDGDDHRARRFALLDSLADLDDAVEQ